MLARISRAAAARFGDRRLVCEPHQEITYAGADAAADHLAGDLAARGVAEGDVVALVLHPGVDWIVASIGVSRVGAVLAGVSSVLTPTERAGLVDLVRPAVVLAHAELVDGLPLRVDTAVLARGGLGTDLAGGARPPELDGDPERAALICFTSGTTGRPKAALFRERQLAAIARIDVGPDVERTWGGGSDMLASTQFAHVGMAAKMPWYLRLGATLHVLDRWRPDDALRLVAARRMPTIGVVAPQLALMLRSALLDELDLSCVQAVIAGGAASPPTLVEEARRRLGSAYSIRYSSTESGGVGLGTAFDAPDDEALHTVGRPRAGVEARIADEGDRPSTEGEVGELQLRSEAVMDRYWNDPAATAAALTEDRWLRTGDLAWRDEQGCIHLAGRRSEMYVRGGYNVFPSEVEAALSSHTQVRDVVVVPVPDGVMGEVGMALVVAAVPASPPTLEDLRALGGRTLSRHKLPERMAIVDTIPLTTAQKVDRRAAAALAGQLLDTSEG